MIMSTITREQLRERAREKVKSLAFSITQTAFADSRAELEEELELARIALASLEAEPVVSHIGSKNALDAIVAFIKSNRNPTLKDYKEVSERLFQDNCQSLSSHVIEYINQIGDELEEFRSTKDSAPPAPVSEPDNEQGKPHPVMAVKGELGFLDHFDRIISERDEDIDIGQLGSSNYEALMIAALDAFRAAMPQGSDTELQRKAAIHDALCEKYNVKSLTDFVDWQRNHIAELEAAPPAPVGPGETAVMPDYPGYTMTQRECFDAGAKRAVPDGWVAVPIEPTYQMCEAMGLPWESPRFPDRYKAMLAAAPNFREIVNSSTNNCRENAETSIKCPCCGRKPLKNKTCSVAGCDGKHVARGFCVKHYALERKKDPSRRESIRAADKRYRARKEAAPQQEV